MSLKSILFLGLLTTALFAQSKSAVQFYDTLGQTKTGKVGWTGDATTGHMFIQTPQDGEVLKTQSGGVIITGTANATKFIGDGSGLTNLPSAQPVTVGTITGLQDSLNKKANVLDVTALQGLVGTKADSISVNTKLSAKANASDVTTLQSTVSGKADTTWVKSKIGTPIDTNWVNGKLSNKANSSDVTALQGQVGAKADSTSVNTKLAAKANASDVATLQGQMGAKTDSIWVKGRLGVKADTTWVTGKLGASVDSNWVNTKLGTKANSSDVTALQGQVGIKADTTWVKNKLPTTLPPSDSAGGQLSGTYPDPNIGIGVITDANISSSANIAGTKISSDFGNQDRLFGGNLIFRTLGLQKPLFGIYAQDSVNGNGGDLQIFSLNDNSIYWRPSMIIERQTNNAYFYGNVIANGTQLTSDLRYKKNVNPISDALEKIDSIKGVTYEWRKEEFPEKSFSNGRHYGIIAQELEKVMPDAVQTDKNGYKSVSYTDLIPVLIEAIKQQQTEIKELQKKITEAKN